MYIGDNYNASGDDNGNTALLGHNEYGEVEKIITSKGKVNIINKDISGRTSFNTLFGDKITAQKVDMISIKFDTGILTNEIISIPLNGATATEINSRLLIQSSTATNGSITFQSKAITRYIPGHDIYAYFTYAWLDGGIAGSKHYKGLFDLYNGYYIGFNGINFVIGRRSNQIDYEQSRNDFIDKLDGNSDSKFNIDFTKINIFRITFGYLGIAPAIFEIYGGAEKGWIKFAVIDIINTITSLAIESPNLPIRIELIKTSGVTNIRGTSGSWNAGYYGSVGVSIGDIANSYNTGLGQALTGTGIEAVVTFRLKATFNGKRNTALARLIHSNFGNTATGEIILGQIIANPTSIGGVAIASLTGWVDVNTTTSMIEYKSDGGVVVGGQAILSEYMVGGGNGGQAKSGEGSVSAQELGLIGKPGDVFTIVYRRVTGSGAYTALTTLNWLELF